MVRVRVRVALALTKLGSEFEKSKQFRAINTDYANFTERPRFRIERSIANDS